MKRVAVVGAGISGLSLAWLLKRRYGNSIQLIILEKSERAGGWIETEEREGFLFERGPRSCRPKGSGIYTLKLIEELGLKDELIEADPAAHRRYLLCNGELQLVPTSPLSLLARPQFWDLIPALCRDLTRAPQHLEEESIFEFFSRRMGKRFAARFADPMTLGIYAGDIASLSLKSCFPLFREWEEKHGSILLGALRGRRARSPHESAFVEAHSRKSLISLSRGMGSLVEALQSQCCEQLLFGKQLRSCRTVGKICQIECSDGSEYEVDKLYCAVPAEELARLPCFGVDQLSSTLGEMRSTSVAVVNLGYRKAALRNPGFGYLIPSSEGEPALGVVFDSCIFPKQNQSADELRLTVMIGEKSCPNFHQYREPHFLSIACQTVARHLGIEKEPDVTSIKIARGAIPQYYLGHEKRVQSLQGYFCENHPQITLLGSSYRGVAVNDCVAESYRVVRSGLTD